MRGGTRIVVVGAGPAGLWSAWRAAMAGHAVTVVERAPQVGGMAASIEVGGLRVDLGSHRLHPSSPPAVLAGLSSLLGADLQTRPRRGRIELHGRWLAFPLRTADLLRNTPPRFAAGAALDAATGSFRRPRDDSFAEVVRVGLGPTVAEGFYEPYVRKIWGESPRRLSGELARRRVSASSSGDLLRRVARGARPEGRVFLYPRRGFGAIAEVLADAATAAGVEIRLGTELVAMDPGDAERPAALDLVGPDGEATTIPADLVWSTAPVAELAARTRPAPPAEVASAIGRLEHRGLVLVYLTLPRSQWTPFDAHYLPATEHLAARVSEPKNYRDSGDDPSDVTVVCAEVPATVGDETWTASDAHLAARLGDDFGRLGLPVVEPAAVTTVRLPKVYPLYRPGFEWDLVALEWWLSANPRLVSFGRQGLFVPDNTHHALVMADAAAASLRADGTFDHGAWGRARAGFHQHVVED